MTKDVAKSDFGKKICTKKVKRIGDVQINF